jgi:hypothetical protein
VLAAVNVVEQRIRSILAVLEDGLPVTKLHGTRSQPTDGAHLAASVPRLGDGCMSERARQRTSSCLSPASSATRVFAICYRGAPRVKLSRNVASHVHLAHEPVPAHRWRHSPSHCDPCMGRWSTGDVACRDRVHACRHWRRRCRNACCGDPRMVASLITWAPEHDTAQRRNRCLSTLAVRARHRHCGLLSRHPRCPQPSPPRPVRTGVAASDCALNGSPARHSRPTGR